MRLMWAALVGWSIGCGDSEASIPIDGTGSNDAAQVDSQSVDATSICDPLAPFGPHMSVPGLATMAAFQSTGPRLTSDELALYFAGFTPSFGDIQLYAAHRSAVTSSFQEANLLPAINLPFPGQPTVSHDGLELWFASTGDASSLLHLYSTFRQTTSDDFNTPVLDPYVNSSDMMSGQDYAPFLTADGQQLWFTSNRPSSPGNFVTNIYHAGREGRSFTTPRVEAIFGETDQGTYSNPVLSADRLTIYVVKFDNLRNSAIWRSHRGTVESPFPAPTPVGDLGFGVPGWLSADNCRMYMTSGSAIVVATRRP